MLGGQTDLWLVADVNVVGYLYGYNYNHGIPWQNNARGWDISTD